MTARQVFLALGGLLVIGGALAQNAQYGNNDGWIILGVGVLLLLIATAVDD